MLEGVDEPFNKAVGGRMVGGASDMLDAVTLQEVLELFTHELRTVVRHELFREALACEDCRHSTVFVAVVLCMGTLRCVKP